MKNQKINSGQIPHLVRLTADLFREMNKEINIGPQAKATQMHFVADLLKDLVDTAYPMEEINDTEIDFVINEISEIVQIILSELSNIERGLKE